MKKIDVPWLGIGQQIWFNIGRIKGVEGLLHKPISEVAKEMTGLNVTNLIVLLQVGNSHNGMKSEQYYEDVIQWHAIGRDLPKCAESIDCERCAGRCNVLSNFP